MTPEHAYEWLFSRTRAAAGQSQRSPAAARRLLDRLGAPDHRFRSVRVVGTNGKGSTCAMLDAGLWAAGVRTGRFTSPHLHRFEERISVAGKELDPARTLAFVQWAQRCASDAAFFDLTLGLAAQVFAEEGVQLAVMEAGVGGASDATHALGGVQAVLLTSVGLDHTGALGGTLTQIAADKAAAAHPGVPLLSAAGDHTPEDRQVLDVVRRVAADIGAPLYLPSTHPELFVLPRSPAMAGAHQRRNAALTLAALRLLGYESGADAALDAVHPGRLEQFVHRGRTVVLDGAHNPAAAQAVAASLPGADTLLFAGFARKDTAQTLAPLLSLAPRRVFTLPDPAAGEGGAPPKQLAEQYGGHAEADPLTALALALELTPHGGTLLVTGSLYLVGVVRHWLVSAWGTEPSQDDA